MDTRTKGSLEAEVAGAVVRFHREQHGRGPSEVRAALLADLAIVRCVEVLTPTETRLATTEGGRRLVRSSRQELRSIVHGEVESIVAGIVGCRVLRSYCDMDVEAGEQIEVYVLERDIHAVQSRDARRSVHPERGGA